MWNASCLLAIGWVILSLQFSVEPHYPKGPENVKNINTISMYGETFYDRHTAQRQMLWSLNNLKRGFVGNTASKVWKPQTHFDWVCSWEILEDATSLTPPSPRLSDTQSVSNSMLNQVFKGTSIILSDVITSETAIKSKWAAEMPIKSKWAVKCLLSRN